MSIPRVYADGRGHRVIVHTEWEADWKERCGWYEVSSPLLERIPGELVITRDGWLLVPDDTPDCVAPEPPEPEEDNIHLGWWLVWILLSAAILLVIGSRLHTWIHPSN